MIITFFKITFSVGDFMFWDKWQDDTWNDGVFLSWNLSNLSNDKNSACFNELLSFGLVNVSNFSPYGRSMMRPEQIS
jgi:hypothetical protein